MSEVTEKSDDAVVSQAIPSLQGGWAPRTGSLPGRRQSYNIAYGTLPAVAGGAHNPTRSFDYSVWIDV